MGDVSRHRDIFLFTRDAVPTPTLDAAGLGRDDLTYLELGNYLTDVSQFRDPVTYIFAKRRIWNEKIIPRAKDKAGAARPALLLAAIGAVAAGQLAKEIAEALDAPTAGDVLGGIGIGAGAAGLLAAALSLDPDLLADVAGMDEWIDKLLGTPADDLPRALTDAARKEHDRKHYGLLGEFFRLVIEGATQALFAQDVQHRSDGPWGQVKPVAAQRVGEVYSKSFTQYYPHEHTDQPPYIWDAGKRHLRPRLYGPHTGLGVTPDEGGVMNVVHTDYVTYLAEGLAGVEDAWRKLSKNDAEGRQRLLVRTGKLLHGVEDWFFHSNVVELLELRTFRPIEPAKDDEDLLVRFVQHVAKTRPEFKLASPEKKIRLQRKLFRRLRFPDYHPGDKVYSAGRASEDSSQTSLRHAYPAFPSSQDTAHTLLHALEHLETQAVGGPGQLPEWLVEAVTAKAPALSGVASVAGPLAKPLVLKGVTDKLRESLPLVLTLLSEDERRRLVANVAPAHWPLATGATPPPRTGDKSEKDLATERHAKALEPHTRDGRTESNYDELARELFERGRINAAGRDALVAAFAVDRTAEKLDTVAPGCGGFLMEYAIELQEQLDEGEKRSAALDDASVIFDKATINVKNAKQKEPLGRAYYEVIGSHSLMSKDTTSSVPFFEEAKVLASVASSTVFTVLMQQVAAPVTDRRLAWEKVLHHLIRFPPRKPGWERQALALAASSDPRKIPTIADLPELQTVVSGSMLPVKKPTLPAPGSQPPKSKREELEGLYRRLETQLRGYRYP